jgi:large subunit ribosomal protein L32e
MDALRLLMKPKRRTKKFIWHKSDQYVKFKYNLQKPRVHKRFKGQILMPTIGYGSNKKTSHITQEAEAGGL